MTTEKRLKLAEHRYYVLCSLLDTFENGKISKELLLKLTEVSRKDWKEMEKAHMQEFLAKPGVKQFIEKVSEWELNEPPKRQK